MRRDAYEIISETNQIVKELRDRVRGKSISEADILNIISRYPVPDITTKQLLQMYANNYGYNYISAVSGLTIEQVHKRIHK